MSKLNRNNNSFALIFSAKNKASNLSNLAFIDMIPIYLKNNALHDNLMLIRAESRLKGRF